MIPMIEDIFVRRHKMIKNQDILDMMAIVQTMPGMIAVNAAIFIGHRLAGFMGAVVAVIGVILPSIIIISLIAALFISPDVQNPHILKAFACVRASVVAVFLGMAGRLIKEVIKTRFDVIIVALFCIALMCGFPQIALILLSIPIGWGYVLCERRKR